MYSDSHIVRAITVRKEIVRSAKHSTSKIQHKFGKQCSENKVYCLRWYNSNTLFSTVENESKKEYTLLVASEEIYAADHQQVWTCW
jgi:hypothetical protein